MRTCIWPCLLLVLASLLLLIAPACRKQKSLKESDVCLAAGKDTSFRIEERLGGDAPRFFATDTVMASQELVYFTACDSTADEYSWQVGLDSRTFSGRTLQLSFGNVHGPLTIQLTQRRRPTNACYGQLPSEATYRRILTVVSPNDAPIRGSFYGCNKSDTAKKFTVTVLDNGVTNIPFPTGKDYQFWNEVDYSSTAFYLKGGGTYDPEHGAFATSGYGYLKGGNRALQIAYSYRKPTTTGVELLKDTFYGIKQ